MMKEKKASYIFILLGSGCSIRQGNKYEWMASCLRLFKGFPLNVKWSPGPPNASMHSVWVGIPW